MANVQVIQRHAHLAGAVKLEFVYGMAFTAEEIDYLDSRAESEARRNGGPGAESGTSSAEPPAPAASTRKPRSARQPAHADA